MSSDFEFVGTHNNQHEFREIATGQVWRLSSVAANHDDKVVLLDGDLITVENNRREITKYSIREQRALGTEYR